LNAPGFGNAPSGQQGPQPLAHGGGGGNNLPTLIPTLYDQTAHNPARELNQVATGAQANNPMSVAFSESGVRYADGGIEIIGNDLSSSGVVGNPWGQTRTWVNGFNTVGQLTQQGNGWVDSQQPWLQTAQNGNMLQLVGSASNWPSWNWNGTSGSWVPNNFSQDTLVDNGSTHQITVVDDTGKQMIFQDFNTAVPFVERGQFQSEIDQFGNVTNVISHTSSGMIQETQSSSTVGSTTITESYYYTYEPWGQTPGLIQNVTERRQVNGGAWTLIRQVNYSYYDGVLAHGNSGDLQSATIEDASGNPLTTYYYRYYVSESGGRPHDVKYVFNPQSYQRLLTALGSFTNIENASDSTVAPYSDEYLQYNVSNYVTQVTLQGAGSSMASSNIGLGTYTFSPNFSTNVVDYNNWYTKVVETLPDGNTNTIYTSAYGEVLLRVYHDQTSGNNWMTYYQYDSAGRLLEEAMPSAVTGYNDFYANLGVTLNANSGLIHLTDYYSSTTATGSSAGGVAGYEEDTKIQEGSSGTAILQETMQYYLVTATIGGVTVSVAPLATDEVYRSTNGTGGETTSYSYTWYSGSTIMQSQTVTKPVISSSENGPGSADSYVTFFDTLQRPVWTKDGDGFINYNTYDQATGALNETIVDVNTSLTGEFSGLPSGWSTPSGGGLNLITTYQVDGLGRTTKLTDPNGNVTYAVYNDPNHEERIYPGWNSSTNMPTGPTQDYREDLTGSYTEMLTMSATPHLTNSVPDGTESVSSIQTLSRDYMNIAGQVTRHDKYFNLSGVTYSIAANIGTLNTNYYESTTDYDARGWDARDVSAVGTITRTVRDGLGRTVSIWVGTNDTPGSGSWSPTNNTSPSNMVDIKSFQYDGGGVGDSDMTQETDYPGGSQANRVTNNYFDWRDRLVVQKQGE